MILPISLKLSQKSVNLPIGFSNRAYDPINFYSQFLKEQEEIKTFHLLLLLSYIFHMCRGNINS